MILPLFLALLTPSSGDELPEWPQWRGPSRDGLVPASSPAWPDGLTDDRLERLWRVEGLGPSYAGPLVVGERVISVETLDKAVEVVRAFDRATGEELWFHEWEGAMKVPFFAARNGSWVRSTPASDGERVFVAGIRDVLVALDLESGEEVWRIDFPEEFGSNVPQFGCVPSPLVHDGFVYMQAGDSLVKIDAESGEVAWRLLGSEQKDSGAFSSPSFGVLGGKEQLVVQSRVDLYGVDLASGEAIWTRPVRAFRGMNILTPTIFDGGVFTTAYGGRAQLVDVAAGEEGWSTEKRWDVGVQGYMTSPVVIDGHAYLFLRSNRFTCVRLEDGEQAWTSGPTGDEYWSLVAHGEQILALTHSGELVLVAADPGEYRELGRAQVSEQETWAHLAVVGDVIFVREQEGLSAFRWR